MLGNEADRVPKQPRRRRSGNCDAKDDPHWGQRYIGGGSDLHFEANGTHQFRSTTASGKTRKERLMAKAVVDPTELRQFATDLRRFNQELENHMRVLQTRIQTLSQSWRDQEQVKFTAEFEEALRSLTRFREASEIHAPFLIRKAERVEEYLKQR